MRSILDLAEALERGQEIEKEREALNDKRKAMCLAICNNDEEKAKRIWVISTQLLEKVAKFSEKCSNFGLIDNSLMMCDPQIPAGAASYC
jgi:hypothetical protein